jgi:hypothetical protein
MIRFREQRPSRMVHLLMLEVMIDNYCLDSTVKVARYPPEPKEISSVNRAG